MEQLTVGQVAKQAGLRTSAIRYYEEQGIIEPAIRNEAGYRLYQPHVVQELRFLLRAQHLGFSLSDIRVLLEGWRSGTLNEDAFIATAEKRYMALERQITHLLTLQHELGLFLQDIYRDRNNQSPASYLAQLIENICLNPLNQPGEALFERLLQRAGCELSTQAVKDLMSRLAGEHIHIWSEGDAFSILIVSDDDQVGLTLEQFAHAAADCRVPEHANQIPELMHNSDGFLLNVRGEHAFIIARIFLEISRQSMID